MNNFSGIREILENNGYPIKDGGDYISTSAIFRNGDNPTAICIYPNDNLVIDFVTSEKYSIPTLIGRILGIEQKEKIDEYLESHNYNLSEKQKTIEEPIIKKTKILDASFLAKLKPDHSYWLGRGISKEVLEELRGGIYKDRYYFPIFDHLDKNKIIGLSSRDLSGKSVSKYKINSEKKTFVFPAFCCDSDIKSSKRVILVEGVPNCMSLMTVGIRGCLVLFGVEVSFAVINYLLRIPDIKIVISTDNDYAGRTGADKIYAKLRKYFDHDQIKIKILDKTKDINEFLVSDGKEAVKDFFNV